MKVLDKIARRFGYNKSETTANESTFYDFFGVDANASSDVKSEATYFACMKVLSESVGKLPLKLLKHKDKNGVETARKHPLFYVVHDRPNPYMSASLFWSTVEVLRNHYGNAYVWIQGFGADTKLWIMPNDEVEVWLDDAKILANQPDIYYIYRHGGKEYRFGSEEVLHFRTSNTTDGVLGIPVRKTLETTVNGGIESQKLLNKMYKSGFTAKAVLNYTGNLSETKVETFIRNTERYAKGELANKGIENVIPMPLGFTLNPLNIKLADNQFIEVRQYNALQIASAFGIKPSQIGDYTKSSYASAEAQQLAFYVDTLLYIVKQYEEELTYKLLTADEIKKGYYFKFNIDVILRADFATKINTLSTAVNSFLMTPNEARAKLDLEGKDGGDALLGNGASIPVQFTGSQYTTSKPDDKPEDVPPNNNDEGGGKK